jgi:hypothetical protein
VHPVGPYYTDQENSFDRHCVVTVCCSQTVDRMLFTDIRQYVFPSAGLCQRRLQTVPSAAVTTCIQAAAFTDKQLKTCPVTCHLRYDTMYFVISICIRFRMSLMPPSLVPSFSIHLVPSSVRWRQHSQPKFP